MKTLINWIHKNKDLPIPLIAAIAQYQFHIISPFENKNTEMGCLLSTLILYLGGYELNGFYSLTQFMIKIHMPMRKLSIKIASIIIILVIQNQILRPGLSFLWKVQLLYLMQSYCLMRMR